MNRERIPMGHSKRAHLRSGEGIGKLEPSERDRLSKQTFQTTTLQPAVCNPHSRVFLFAFILSFRCFPRRTT